MEYIIDTEPVTICSFKKSFKAKGIPDTYIRYKIIRPESATQPPPIKQNELNLNGYLLRNTESNLCLSAPKPTEIIKRSDVKLDSCDETKSSQRFLLLNDKLKPFSQTNQCLSFDPNQRIILYTCIPNNFNQTWKHDVTTGHFTNNNLCLSLFVAVPDAQKSTPIINRPYGVALTNCSKKDISMLKSWRLEESTIDTMIDDGAAIPEEVGNHQYVQGSLVEISNVLNDEIRNMLIANLFVQNYSLQ